MAGFHPLLLWQSNCHSSLDVATRTSQQPRAATKKPPRLHVVYPRGRMSSLLVVLLSAAVRTITNTGVSSESGLTAFFALQQMQYRLRFLV